MNARRTRHRPRPSPRGTIVSEKPGPGINQRVTSSMFHSMEGHVVLRLPASWPRPLEVIEALEQVR